jgi:NAD-dependent SIR2 family protein deacetylase
LRKKGEKRKMETQTNSGRLCSVYCPDCGKVTDKISFNLLREAGKVTVCCLCGGETYLEWKNGVVTISHKDAAAERAIAEMKSFQKWWQKLSEEERQSWLLTNGS